MVVTRYVKVGIESSYGAGASSLRGMRINRMPIHVDRGALKDPTIENYMPEQIAGGPLKISGSPEFSVRADEIGEILYAVIGKVSTTGGGPYVHKFELSDPQSLEFEVGENNTAWSLRGVGIDSITLTFEAKEFVKCSIDYIARSIEETNFSAPSFGSHYPLVFHQVKVSRGSLQLGLHKATLKVSRSLKDDMYVLDSYKLDSLMQDGEGELSGTLTCTERQLSEIRKAMFIDGSELPDDDELYEFELEIDARYGSGPNLRRLRVTAPVTLYTEASWELSGRDYIEREISYQVAGDLEIELTNGVSHY